LHQFPFFIQINVLEGHSGKLVPWYNYNAKSLNHDREDF
jgi:hypothetical protein